MKLELTNRTLSRLSEMDNPAVEDVLNVIYDFCHDIKDETGMSVDKLECRSEDDLFKRLPWLGRTVTKISIDKEPQISKQSRLEKLQEMSETLNALDAQISEAEEVRKQWTEEKARLEAKKQSLDEEKSREKLLLAEIEQIRSGIRELEELDYDALTRQKEEAAGRKEQLSGRLEALKLEIAANESAQEELNREISAKEEEKNAVVETINNGNQTLEQLKAALEQKSEEKDTVFSACTELEEQIRGLDQAVQEQNAKRDELQAECNTEEMQLKKLDAERAVKQIDQLQNRLAQLRGMNEKLSRDWNSAWGQEQRELNPQMTGPSEILKQEISDAWNRLRTYRSDLQKVINFLSSEGMQ